jgi:Zn-dependent peptidase ImmA (M78 family)
MREVAVELADLLDESPPPFPLVATLDEDPELAAARARDALGVSVDAQRAWADPFEALRHWRSAIERLGILALQTRGVRVDEARGLSIPSAAFPVIVVNGSDTAHGRIFSLMHELAHLVHGQDARCDISMEDEDTDASGNVERWCNAFAGALLVPRADLLPMLRRGGSSTRWTDEDIAALSRAFRVSQEVIVRRLLAVGRTTEAFYRRKRSEYRARGQRPQTGGNFYRTHAARVGGSFARLVFSGLAEGHITGIDAALYLGVKTKQLARLQEIALGGAAAQTG